MKTISEAEKGTFRPDFISDQELKVASIILACTLMAVLAVVGTVFNIINIIVFIKLGFKDTANITLLGISVADAGAMVTLLWGSVCQNPLLVEALSSFEMFQIQFQTSGWPHLYFMRVTGWLTCVVTIERYLCIACPLIIRNLVTPTRMAIVNFAVFAIMAALILPVFVFSELGPIYNPSKNRTVIGLKISTSASIIINTISVINNLAQFVSFFIVALMTAQLVQKLHATTRWRKSVSTFSKNLAATTTRDHDTVKMVIFISVLFITCFIPTVALFIAMKIETEFNLTSRYKNLFAIVAVVIALVETISPIMSIFIYVKMSSRYRAVLLSVFPRL